MPYISSFLHDLSSSLQRQEKQQPDFAFPIFFFIKMSFFDLLFHDISTRCEKKTTRSCRDMLQYYKIVSF